MTGCDELIGVAMKSLRDVGFINYYGMQRFGTTRVTTHNIGRCVVKFTYWWCGESVCMDISYGLQ